MSVSGKKQTAFVDFERGRFVRTSTLPTGTGPSARQRKRSANQEAGDKAEQGKNADARQRMRAANQEAGDKAEQGNNTEARQRKRAGIRDGTQTGIQPQASARPMNSCSVELPRPSAM